MLNERDNPEISESVIFSVSEVTLHLRQVIETQIEALYIVGEISNFVRHGSGHLYFNLKDNNAVIRCAFFRNVNFSIDFQPQDGDQVICFGKISVFDKSGQYQLLVQNMYPYGKGALQQKFEQLKLKLKSEGLFDVEHKKPLPEYPESIGIITSPTGAALQDILNVLGRRHPCSVIVFSALMQGNAAPEQVIKGLQHFNAAQNVNLIIIARGGGSQEDLFCFNDENLARAIFESKLPIVSAIGHEIDFTIADFVADLRAPTPSAAAELVTPDTSEIHNLLDKHLQNLYASISRSISRFRSELQKNHLSLMKHYPERIWQSFQIRCDEATTKLMGFTDLLTNVKAEFIRKQSDFIKENSNLQRFFFQSKQHKIELIKLNMQHAINNAVLKCGYRLQISEARVDELSPRETLNRGFSLVKKQGKLVQSVELLNQNDELELILSDGSAQVSVIYVQSND
jgi:exodeoxyribonuclease VII large subunit